MFKVKNGLVPSYIREIFDSAAPKGYNLRNTDFNIPRYNSVHYGKHSLRYFGPYLWSKLNHSDRNKQTNKQTVLRKNIYLY